MSGYNGWSNRATWNVSLWLSNDEGLYNEVNRLERRHTDTDEDGNETGDLDAFAEDIEAFCKELWPAGVTPDGDKLADADFEEIATAWIDK